MIAVLTMATALAGCTSSGSPASHSSSPSGTPKLNKPLSGGRLPPGVTAATSVPTAVPNKVALRQNVAMSTCAAAPGGWRASGVARNPRHRPVSYTITVFFTTKTATVIGFGKTKVRVKPGASAPWKVRGRFHAPKPTLCVLRGVG